MPYNSWNPPPEWIKRAFANATGELDAYDRAARQWHRVLAQYPELRYSGGPVPQTLRQWYRSPEDWERMRREGYSPAAEGQHGAGLAVDVAPSDPEGVAAAAQAAGFHVIPYPTHLHVQTYEPTAWQRIRPLLRGLGIFPGE